MILFLGYKTFAIGGIIAGQQNNLLLILGLGYDRTNILLCAEFMYPGLDLLKFLTVGCHCSRQQENAIQQSRHIFHVLAVFFGVQDVHYKLLEDLDISVDHHVGIFCIISIGLF